MTTKTPIDELFMRVEVTSDNLATFSKILSVFKNYHFNPTMIKDFELALDGNNLPVDNNISYNEADILKAKPIIDSMCSTMEQKLYPTQLELKEREIINENARLVVDEKNQFLSDFSTLFLELEDECIERRNELERKNEGKLLENFDYNNKERVSDFFEKEIDVAEKVKAQFFQNLKNKLNEGFKAVHTAEEVLKNPTATLNERQTAVKKVHECDHIIGDMLMGAQQTLSGNVMASLNDERGGKSRYSYEFCNGLVQYVMSDVVLLSDVNKYGKESEQLYEEFNLHYSDDLDLDKERDFYDPSLDDKTNENEYDDDDDIFYGSSPRI